MARAKKKNEQPTEDVVIETTTEAVEEIFELEAETIEETEEVEETVSEDSEDGEELVMTPEDVRLVEAMLFASSSALTVGQMAERFPQDRVKLIPDVLEYLREQYASRGVNLVQRESRWALRTATDLGDQLRLEKEQPKKFTRAAMETMAVVAYHQPVTRAEIENIRGVATSPGALDALMEAGWIKPGKRREVPGRPVTWLTTQAFLDHFGLEKLEDLPGMEELKAAGLLDKRPAIEAMPTADLFGDDENKVEEGEDPQEVTDEDLLGKPDANDEVGFDEDGDDETIETTMSDDEDDMGGDEDDDDDEDDEDTDDDDFDNDSSDDEDDNDDDEDSDEEDFDDEDEDDEDEEDEEDED